MRNFQNSKELTKSHNLLFYELIGLFVIWKNTLFSYLLAWAHFQFSWYIDVNLHGRQRYEKQHCVKYVNETKTFF